MKEDKKKPFEKEYDLKQKEREVAFMEKVKDSIFWKISFFRFAFSFLIAIFANKKPNKKIW